MAQRTVKGEVRSPNAAWAKARIVFTLLNSSFTSDALYPSSSFVVYAGADGKFEASLWTNEDGEIPCRYSCRIEDSESFEFVLPSGVGDIQLSALREAVAVAPNTPNWTSILTAVEQRLQNAGVGGGLPWVEQSTPRILESNKAYKVSGNTLTLLTLPIMPINGDRIVIYNAAASNFRITQQNGQRVRVGNQQTTTGVTGRIESRAIGDWIELNWLDLMGWISTNLHGNLEII